MSFNEFLYYNDFPFSLECNVDIETWIQDVNFFKFLSGIDKNIFRSEVVRTIFPKQLNNIKKYLQLDYSGIKELFIYWRDNDITFEEFELFSNKHLK